jgi:hypothetical protein
MIQESTEKIPAPPRIKDSKPAIYNKTTSYPGGPKTGPSRVKPIVFIELNPYLRCTVKKATNIIIMSGREVIITKAPTKIAKPPKISTRGEAQEVK